MFDLLRRTVPTLAVLALCGPVVRAQCLDWRAFPDGLSGIEGDVGPLLVHDDGSGPALYVGGLLRSSVTSTPGTDVGILRWDGAHVTPVGDAPIERALALVTFDDGSGPALYAAFEIPYRVMKWNGSVWQQVGAEMDTHIGALAVHDDGGGPALYAGGFFTTVGGAPAAGIVKWTGTAWIPLGSGPNGGVPGPLFVISIASHDDGSGPALWVGGIFAGVPGASSPNIAKWSAGAWSGVGAGADDDVSTLVSWDDGSGPSLFALGEFTSPAMHVARWNGSAWHPVGAGLAENSVAARVLDVGGGSRLWAATWTSVSGPRLQNWNGSTWSALALPPSATCSSGPFIASLAAFDEGSGPHLFAGTLPGTLGDVDSVVSRLVGTDWQRVGPGPRGLDGPLRALAVHDDGSGPALYAGGEFCRADEAWVTNVARFDGTTWSAVGHEIDQRVTALASFDPGSGPMLVAASFDGSVASPGARLSRWSGSSWVHVVSTGGANDAFFALQPFGAHLYVGGTFGGTSPNLLRWNPAAGVSGVGTSPNAGVNGSVSALTTFDDGSGLALYAGGSFTVAGATSANHVARFDGTSWSALGGGTDAPVDALAVFDDGSGPALYAGGAFTTAGGVPASCIAKWNGTTWSALGAGLDARVLTLEVLDDGSGPALYAGGHFTASASVPMTRIARWDGATWSGLGGGIDDTVWSLKAFDDGNGAGADLFAAGVFQRAGAQPSASFAAWRGCGAQRIAKHCFGDGSTGACPCGNQGMSGRGCDNSLATGGARLNATGRTSPDSIVLHASGELPNAVTLVFQGASALSQPLAFGDGFRCVGGSIQRLYTTNAVNGAVTVPGIGQPSISARSAMLGVPLTPGTVKSYQAWYRDPNLAFCAAPAGNAWNLSNAVRIVW